MSSTKSKLDLLVRVRYHNPLPAPPYPPKLLNIPTNPERYATLEYTGDYANNVPFPMVVDAELGMPLDLGRYECLWQDGGDPQELNPDPENLPAIDSKDEFLLEGYAPQSSSRGGSQVIPGSQMQVSWLRRTEYVTAKDSISKASTLSRDEVDEDFTVDVSRDAQIRDIESTFPGAPGEAKLSSFRHPIHTKRRAVEYYDVFPDPETFATAFDVFRFSERPGDRAADEEDPRLESAIIRPVRLADGEAFNSYYIAQDDDSAAALREQRNFALKMNTISEIPPVQFVLTRDYDTKVVMNEAGNELVLMFEDGDLTPHVDAVGTTREPEQRSKGVYFKVINRRYVAKRRRIDPNDPRDDTYKPIEILNVSYRALDEAERLERLNETEELMNPDYEPPEEEEEPSMVIDDGQQRGDSRINVVEDDDF